MRKTGIAFIVFGALLIAGALFLFFRNNDESRKAEEVCATVTSEIKDVIRVRTEERTQSPVPTKQPDPYNQEEILRSYEMTVVEIDGYGYIGYISIPKIDVELPVMSELDYGRLKIAPCRMVGSVRSGDIIIGAHNIQSMFGRLGELTEGDVAYFTDMDGETRRYVVTEVEIIGLTDAAGLKAGEWDMTVFTCTYGGGKRIVVRMLEVPDGYDLKSH